MILKQSKIVASDDCFNLMGKMMANSPLLWAVAFIQQLDPLAGLVSASAFWSTVVAALPVIVLFGCWWFRVGLRLSQVQGQHLLQEFLLILFMEPLWLLFRWLL